MNPIVKKYLATKKEEKLREYQEYKANLLIQEGLIEKIYGKGEGFYEMEWDEITQERKFYKAVPIDVTEEEFAEIEKYAKIRKKDTATQQKDDINTIKKCLLFFVVLTCISLISEFIFVIYLFSEIL